MPLKRLERTRESLPSGYQYGDAASGAHQHVFNEISRYCHCGIQYIPDMAEWFPNGFRVGGIFVATALNQISKCEREQLAAMTSKHATCPRCGHPIYQDAEGIYCPTCGPVLKA